jgi:hypothetical protein
MDMTWLAGYPILINVMTHVTVAWELSYCALVWPRLTRPIVILMAIPLHMGIAICLGMVTFGLAMLIGNLAFVSPSLVRALVEWRAGSKQGRGEVARSLTPAATRPARPAQRSSSPQ